MNAALDRRSEERRTLSPELLSGTSFATPRIQKPGEMGLFGALAKQQPDAVLVRNLSGLEYFVARGLPSVADFSLYVVSDGAGRSVRRASTRFLRRPHPPHEG